MRVLITLIGSLLVVGCWSYKPLKETASETVKEQVVGTYERKGGLKLIFLDNGVCEAHVPVDGVEWAMFVYGWKIAGGKVEVGVPGASMIYDIDLQGDLTAIAMEANRKRHEIPNHKQLTLKKIK